MATRSFFALGNPTGASLGAGAYSVPIHGAYTQLLSSTSTQYFQYRAAVPFTLSNLRAQIRVTSTATGRVTATKNEADQSLEATIPADALTIGDISEDSSNSVEFAAGDKVGLSASRASGTLAFQASALITASGTGAVAPYLAVSSGTTIIAAARRLTLSGSLALTSAATGGLAAIRATSSGTLRGLFMYVTSNASTGVAVATAEAYVASTATGLNIDVGVGETGYFFENSTPISVADGQYVDVQTSGTTGASVTIRAAGLTIVNDGRAFDVYDYGGGNIVAATIGTGLYMGLTGGNIGSISNEANLAGLEHVLHFPARLSRAHIHVRNYSTVDLFADILLDGVETGIVIPLPFSAAAANYADDTHSVDALAGQRVSWRFRTADGSVPPDGGLQLYGRSLRVEDLTVEPATVSIAGTSTFSPVGVAAHTRSFAMSGTSAAAFVVSAETPEVRTLTIGGTSAFSPLGEYVVGDFSIQAEIQTLTPSARIELFELDASILGGTIYRFHAGVNGLVQPIVWAGEEYSPFPVQATGFEYSGQGPLPRPKFRVANVAGVMSALVMLYDDLAGCKVTRIRTMAKFLDAVNFPDGNPTEDPEAEYPREVYYIDRKSSESRDLVEFELSSSLDMAGVMFPSRQVVQNYCPWAYRGAECGYTGTDYFDTNDQVVAVVGQDVCGKRLSSCRARFGQYGELPYGGFPAAGLLRM